jgi:signal transduction histidine kinase
MLENNVSVRGEEFLQADLPGQPRYGLAVLLQGSQKVIGMFCLQNSGGYAYTVEDQKALESFAAHAAIAIENTNLYRRAQETAVNRERQRLSRELHDSVTQLLYSISLLSSGWKKMAQDGRLADPAGSFQELEGISSLALIEMRLLLHQLRPSVLQEAGLVGALKSRLEAVEQRLNIETRFVVEGDLPPLSNSLEEQLYDIVQEALNNALRHAMATAVYINIRHEVGRLILMVQDNGIGFSPEEISAGIGLQSMHERAEVISAELSIHSEVQKGTTVQVAVSI